MDSKLQTVLAVWPYPQNNAANLFGDWDFLCCLSVRRSASQPDDVAGNIGKIYFKFNSHWGRAEAVPAEQFDAIAREAFHSSATFIKSE